MDLRSSVSGGRARPGFPYTVLIWTSNLGASSTGAYTVSAEFDPLLQFSHASPASGLTVQGNTLTWQLPALNAFNYRSIAVTFQVPADVDLLGTNVTVSAVAQTINTDANPTNNSSTWQQVITGAYDPNDKLARTSSGSSTWWDPEQDQWVDYTIRFQNTGTDTAFNVLIVDTLPAQLDPASLQVLGASHPFEWLIRDAGILKFAFPGILLPDSNVNEPLSHGLVSFRIRMREGAMTQAGELVSNSAGIYFDFNPPIITEPSVLTTITPIRLDARAWLGGAYDAPTAAMRDDLRAQALVPLTEPYTALGYTHSGEGGGESISPALRATTGPTAIVDWVVLELRDPAQPATVLHSRSALLRRDGRITDKDGTSPVAFNAPPGNYRIALRHRNHLGVISAAPIALGGTATTWDARTTATALFGTTPTIIDGAIRLLWPGDGNGDGTVKYSGVNNDRDPVLVAIGGTIPTAVINGVYNALDVNLDGTVRYAGTNNDRDIMLQTIGGTVPTTVRVGQTP